MVRTCRQTPRFWGAPGIETWRCRRLFQFLRMAGALIFEILRLRPCRTSWLIVGTKTLLLSVGLVRWSLPTGSSGDPPVFRRANGPVAVMVEDGSPAQAPKADPSRGHEGGVYQRPETSVKRLTSVTGAVRRDPEGPSEPVRSTRPRRSRRGPPRRRGTGSSRPRRRPRSSDPRRTGWARRRRRRRPRSSRPAPGRPPRRRVPAPTRPRGTG